MRRDVKKKKRKPKWLNKEKASDGPSLGSQERHMETIDLKTILYHTAASETILLHDTIEAWRFFLHPYFDPRDTCAR